MNLVKLIVLSLLLCATGTAFSHKTSDENVEVLNARMQRVERVLDSQALINMSTRIDSLQREVQVLRGENESLQNEIENLKTRQREQYLEIDRRLQSTVVAPTSTVTDAEQPIVTTGVATDASTPVQPTTTEIPTVNNVATIGTAPASSPDVAQDYKKAFTLLKQGKYDDSIVAFQTFLQAHPNSKYASNAQYWLAEANYVSKRYPTALTEFSKVINTYPASSKVADAKLKLGFTYYELEQYEQARAELTRLQAQFPNSSVASLAQQRLERMSREGH